MCLHTNASLHVCEDGREPKKDAHSHQGRRAFRVPFFRRRARALVVVFLRRAHPRSLQSDWEKMCALYWVRGCVGARDHLMHAWDIIKMHTGISVIEVLCAAARRCSKSEGGVE
mgnify:CR=1 FL=1